MSWCTVFRNLLENAVKYSLPDSRAVEISVTETDAHAIIRITDDGPGIAAQHLPRLTERFYRVNVLASRERGGTGLGLAIVKHILNRHRGELNITSTVGQGSTFASFCRLRQFSFQFISIC
jgi:two-component system phosphate regulon sensor histidine kinase PhoR